MKSIHLTQKENAYIEILSGRMMERKIQKNEEQVYVHKADGKVYG